jgi:hypothetical protein
MLSATAAAAAAAACCQVHGVELVQTDLVAGLMPRLAGAVDLLVRAMQGKTLTRGVQGFIWLGVCHWGMGEECLCHALFLVWLEL